MSYRIEVEDGFGRALQLALDAERFVIGSAAHCDVRLPVESAEPEHVEVRLGSGASWARALSFTPPPQLDGAPFGEAPLAADAVLTIGRARVRIVTLEARASAPKAVQRKARPGVIAVLGGIIALMLLVLTNDLHGTARAAAPEAAPPLWGASVTACERTEPRQARVLAHDRLVLAESKRERSPFSPHDGVAAVPLFEEAAACFRSAGDADASSRAANAAAALREQVQRDYRTRQMRLEHALAIHDYANAEREIVTLLALTDGQSGAYVTWLALQHRQLRLQADQAKKRGGGR